MNSIIKFLRSREVYNSLENAQRKLNLIPQKKGQPVIAYYWKNKEKGILDNLFVVGTKDGTGRDCYSIISSGSEALIGKIFFKDLPDITELLYGEIYIYSSESEKINYWVWQEGGVRIINPISEEPILVKESSTGILWWVSKNQCRKASNVVSKEELKEAILQVGGDTTNDILKLKEDLENQINLHAKDIERVEEDLISMKESLLEIIDNEVKDLEGDLEITKAALNDEISQNVEILENQLQQLDDKMNTNSNLIQSEISEIDSNILELMNEVFPYSIQVRKLSPSENYIKLGDTCQMTLSVSSYRKGQDITVSDCSYKIYRSSLGITDDLTLIGLGSTSTWGTILECNQTETIKITGIHNPTGMTATGSVSINFVNPTWYGLIKGNPGIKPEWSIEELQNTILSSKESEYIIKLNESLRGRSPLSYITPLEMGQFMFVANPWESLHNNGKFSSITDNIGNSMMEDFKEYPDPVELNLDNKGIKKYRFYLKLVDANTLGKNITITFKP